MRWMQKQRNRCRRFLALLPYMFDSPYNLPFVLRKLFSLICFGGFEGFKSFCRTIEAQRNLGVCPDVKIDPGKLGYIIVAPDYVPNSAGIGCVYRLCDELNRRGFPSYIVGSNRTVPSLMAPLIDWNKAKNLCKQGFIAIYTETVTGNPLHARSVARWVANRPGLLGGEEVYEESELVFYYAESYLPYIRNRIAGKLYMPTIDESIFYSNDRDSSERSLECFYVGKSQWKEGFIDRNEVFEITRDMPPKKELGKLLRASRVLYNFDNSTILTYEAIMCGCPVVIIPDGTQTREDYERSELGMDGIAWGPEELNRVKVDIPGLQRHYEQVKREFIQQLDDFIAITQRHALQFASSPTCKTLTSDNGSRSFRVSA